MALGRLTVWLTSCIACVTDPPGVTHVLKGEEVYDAESARLFTALPVNCLTFGLLADIATRTESALRRGLPTRLELAGMPGSSATFVISASLTAEAVAVAASTRCLRDAFKPFGGAGFGFGASLTARALSCQSAYHVSL